eukprot:TRINITY_DN4115_c0_g1_i6.p1 TRINITY_DN4115_c0_g1~~TRINITY_DN4115_c0_g1_i6.p1  ORF type:complete len:347 (-),score=66.94 TRINITY_DN4115_c0_g1_i6:371-1360(-)
MNGKRDVSGMYGREVRDVVAKLLACPDILGSEIVQALLSMLSLAQLLYASWRKAVGRRNVEQRDQSAAIMELCATLLAPLFAVFKPLDPVTGDAGAQNLYLHTASAHARAHSGSLAPPVPLVSDDDIEGIIRHLNTYSRTRVGSICRVEALVDLKAIAEFKTAVQRHRFTAEAAIYTSVIEVCACFATLGASMGAGLVVAKTLAQSDEHLSTSTSTGVKETAVTSFHLPKDVIETRGTILEKAAAADATGTANLGMEHRIALALLRRQDEISVCFCGNIDVSDNSPMAEALLAARANDAVANGETPSTQAPAVHVAAPIQEREVPVPDG